MPFFFSRGFLSFCFLSLSLACSSELPAENNDAGSPTVNTGSCAVGSICEGNVAICNDPENIWREDCVAMGMRCIVRSGCRVCDPGSSGCVDGARAACRGDGSGYDIIEECPEGCAEGVCVNLCEEAARTFSYTGCEYWPVPVANQVDETFRFAVAIASASDTPAEIEVTRGGQMVRSASLPPRTLEVIELPWIDELKSAADDETHYSVKVSDGAYRLTSTAPITVYQFNPLHYTVPRDCERRNDEPDGRCLSYSNDASLLLPSTALSGSYINLGFPSLHLSYQLGAEQLAAKRAPATVTIIAIDDGPVEIQSPVPLAASASGDVPAVNAGGRMSVNLARGEVLQLAVAPQEICPEESPTSQRSPIACGSSSCVETACRADRNSDPTGISIESPGRLQVISGHSCAFIPFDR
ncbi:MAG: hypothetical protein VYD19_01400, partial [Myxococcota bacterium]|nr:hypothetical protein [Myxococcota bacterium]